MQLVRVYSENTKDYLWNPSVSIMTIDETRSCLWGEPVYMDYLWNPSVMINHTKNSSAIANVVYLCTVAKSDSKGSDALSSNEPNQSHRIIQHSPQPQLPRISMPPKSVYVLMGVATTRL